MGHDRPLIARRTANDRAHRDPAMDTRLVDASVRSIMTPNCLSRLHITIYKLAASPPCATMCT
jgi:hypothetical protein